MTRRGSKRYFLRGLSAVLFIVSLLVGTAPGAGAASFASLTLVNGWTNAPFSASNAAASISSGIVTLAGAISTAGTNAQAFTLPKPFRPATNVFVPIDLCGATNGRLLIAPNGVVTVQAESSFANAQCFTSLDGASFGQKSGGFTALSLQNGWTNGPFGTGNAAVKTISGVVHFEGAISTAGTNPVAFTLPVGSRPATNVFVKVDMCNATNGRLAITPSGVVTVQAEGGNFSNAQCFTSLEGASFAKSSSNSTGLTLQNGWTNGPFGTASAAVRNISGVVHFEGAIATSGTNAVPFTLPAAFRPATNVFVPVDLCGATNGRLDIAPGGVVTVEAEGGTFSNAQCFTSLDGVSFDATAVSALTLVNGWTNGPFGTSNVAASVSSGIVTLAGAMATSGTNSAAFTLPAGFRPATNVFVPVDLCSATNGRLDIGPNGVVTVEAEGGTFSNAQCFTSLDGVSFAQTAGGFTALSLQNGWTNGPFGTANAAVKTVSGVVHFEGAIATSGTNPVAFTLPVGSRPATNVFVKVDMCSATNGRLAIAPTGVVSVQASTFSNAQCFTSLDGASFAKSSSGYTALTLKNGWTNGPFATANAAVKNVSGVVHFEGAIATSGTNPVPFTLPSGFRPATNVFVPVDMCGATNGRLDIAPTGVVTVEAQGGLFSNAQCLTSLDGVSFDI